MPYLLLGAAQLAVGAAAIFARYALGGAAPLAIAALRLSLAAAVLLLAALLRRPAGGRVTRRQGALLACAGAALALHFATWLWSLEYTTVAISTLLVSTAPIGTALYDAVAIKRPLSRRAVCAFACGGAGLALVVGFNRTRAPDPGHAVLGALLALAGGVAIAAYFLLVREVRGALDTRAIVTRTYAWAAAGLVAAAAIARQAPPRLDATAAWGGILAMAFVSQLLGHTALNAALRWFSPSAVAFSTLLEPVCAAGLALAIFGERMSPLALAGGAMLLAAIGVFLIDERGSGGAATDGSTSAIGLIQ